MSAADDDAFSHVANWFRLHRKAEGGDSVAASATAERVRPAAAAAAETHTLRRDTSRTNTNRQLRKLTLQDRITRRPRVQTRQEAQQGTQGGASGTPAGRQLSGRQHRWKTNSHGEETDIKQGPEGTCRQIRRQIATPTSRR